MSNNLDKTFCASPNCENECGRKMSEEEAQNIPSWRPVSYAYFCGVSEQYRESGVNKQVVYGYG